MHKQINDTTLVLNGAIDSTQVTCVVTGDTSNVDDKKPIYAVIESETVEVTNVSGQTLTIVRGINSANTAHINGSDVVFAHMAECINELIEEKVDTEAGKGLSEEDFTAALLTKINNIENNANNYIHPANHLISEVNGLQTALDGKTNKNILTTKGDIYVQNGSDIVRLPVGSNDQILVADSAEALGVKWEDKPAQKVFGDGFEEDYKQAAESNANQTTYHTFVSQSKPVGKYRIEWKVTVVGSNTSNDAICWIEANGTQLGERFQLEPKDVGTDQRGNFVGHSFITLATAGTITINTIYDSSSTNIARVYDSQLEVWRVS